MSQQAPAPIDQSDLWSASYVAPSPMSPMPPQALGVSRPISEVISDEKAQEVKLENIVSDNKDSSPSFDVNPENAALLKDELRKIGIISVNTDTPSTGQPETSPRPSPAGGLEDMLMKVRGLRDECLQRGLNRIEPRMTTEQLIELNKGTANLLNTSSSSASTSVHISAKQACLKRIQEREERLFSDLRQVNGRLAEIDIQQSYPLSPELIFRDNLEITDHMEPTVPALFRKLDTASEADRRAFAANLLTAGQIDHLLRIYELRYLSPVDMPTPQEGVDIPEMTEAMLSNTVQPFDESKILSKAIEFMDRFQWRGGGIYVDDETWGVHPRAAGKPDGDFCITNTMDNEYLGNLCLEKYLDDFCYLLERFFTGLTAGYKTRSIKRSNRVLLIIYFNSAVNIAEKKRRRLEESMSESSNSDNSDDEDVGSDDDEEEEDILSKNNSSSDESDAQNRRRNRRSSASSQSGAERDM